MKEGIQKVTVVGEKEQEKSVYFKGGALLKDKHRINLLMLAVTL